MDRKDLMFECLVDRCLEVACDRQERLKSYGPGTVVSFEHPPPRECMGVDNVDLPYQRGDMYSACPAFPEAESPMASDGVHETSTVVNHGKLQAWDEDLQDMEMHVEMNTMSGLILGDHNLPWC